MELNQNNGFVGSAVMVEKHHDKEWTTALATTLYLQAIETKQTEHR